MPPTTVITHVRKVGGKVVVRGTTSDNGDVAKVLVNGREARFVHGKYGEWTVELDAVPADGRVQAHAEDAARNVEPRPHVRKID